MEIQLQNYPVQLEIETPLIPMAEIGLIPNQVEIDIPALELGLVPVFMEVKDIIDEDPQNRVLLQLIKCLTEKCKKDKEFLKEIDVNDDIVKAIKRALPSNPTSNPTLNPNAVKLTMSPHDPPNPPNKTVNLKLKINPKEDLDLIKSIIILPILTSHGAYVNVYFMNKLLMELKGVTVINENGTTLENILKCKTDGCINYTMPQDNLKHHILTIYQMIAYLIKNQLPETSNKYGIYHYDDDIYELAETDGQITVEYPDMPSQEGGNNDIYKMKYIKYKNKYINAKKMNYK